MAHTETMVAGRAVWRPGSRTLTQAGPHRSGARQPARYPACQLDISLGHPFHDVFHALAVTTEVPLISLTSTPSRGTDTELVYHLHFHANTRREIPFPTMFTAVQKPTPSRLTATARIAAPA